MILFSVEQALVGRVYETRKRPEGFIVEATRRDNADTVVDDEVVFAYVVRVRPYGTFGSNDYYQTLYVEKPW